MAHIIWDSCTVKFVQMMTLVETWQFLERSNLPPRAFRWENSKAFVSKRCIIIYQLRWASLGFMVLLFIIKIYILLYFFRNTPLMVSFFLIDTSTTIFQKLSLACTPERPKCAGWRSWEYIQWKKFFLFCFMDPLYSRWSICFAF